MGFPRFRGALEEQLSEQLREKLARYVVSIGRVLASRDARRELRHLALVDVVEIADIEMESRDRGVIRLHHPRPGDQNPCLSIGGRGADLEAGPTKRGDQDASEAGRPKCLRR